ncbi:MAG: hypothetical protein M3N42_05940 [Cyanobacteriota bacterium]|nr:hypothetical protein [Cyanobacteriota bacterium]
MGTVRQKSVKRSYPEGNRPSQTRSSARESFVAGAPSEKVGFCAESAGFRSIELEFVDIRSRIAIVK